MSFLGTSLTLVRVSTVAGLRKYDILKLPSLRFTIFILRNKIIFGVLQTLMEKDKKLIIMNGVGAVMNVLLVMIAATGELTRLSLSPNTFPPTLMIQICILQQLDLELWPSVFSFLQ